MMPALPRLTLTAMIASLIVVGCAHQPAPKPAPAPSTTAATTTTSTTTGGSSTHHQHRTVAPNGHVTVEDVNLPDHTGIPACDDYLASYMACHRAAAIFTPDQLPLRYQEMRTSLLIDSENPDIRPQLAARCNSLSGLLREALHGKSCTENPAPAGASSTH